MQKSIRIATRKSPLALWQAQFVADQLKALYPQIEIKLVPLVTSGDKFLKDKLIEAGGKGLFIKELEEALLANQADIAVHSMKDVPAAFPEGLILSAICERHDPFDVLISKNHKKLEDLPKGAIIGTSSLRRQSQLLAFNPEFKIKMLRGNINTRLEKLEKDDFDAIILAKAGLLRMQMQQQISQTLDEKLMLPACGQGAIGIESREKDIEIKELLAPLNHPLTALCVSVERAINAKLGGSCRVPLAVFCKPNAKGSVLLQTKVLSEDGSIIIADSREGLEVDAPILAEETSSALLAKGAQELLSQYQ